MFDKRNVIDTIVNFNNDLFNHCDQWLRFIFTQVICLIVYFTYAISTLNINTMVQGYFTNRIMFIGIIIWVINYLVSKF